MIVFTEQTEPEKIALDKIINKSRVHFYKPIQIAEILFHDRIVKDINLSKLETYRNKSKQWRDAVCKILVGRTSTSSAKFQDNLFEQNALPPKLIVKLGTTNRKCNGCVENYIYQQLHNKLNILNDAINYCENTDPSNFYLLQFLDLFEQKTGLKRSVDKIYEIVVYCLFSTLIDAMGIKINIALNDTENPILKEFDDFAQKVLGVSSSQIKQQYPAKLFRLGITNAADRGLDMWGNFGLAIQIKHLSLSEELAEGVVGTISADRIVIVCKDAEEKIIKSLLNQIGWRSKIQSIITINELVDWYDRALRGAYYQLVGDTIIRNISKQIEIEFPSTSKNNPIIKLFKSRGYQF